MNNTKQKYQNILSSDVNDLAYALQKFDSFIMHIHSNWFRLQQLTTTTTTQKTITIIFSCYHLFHYQLFDQFVVVVKNKWKTNRLEREKEKNEINFQHILSVRSVRCHLVKGINLLLMLVFCLLACLIVCTRQMSLGIQCTIYVIFESRFE